MSKNITWSQATYIDTSIDYYFTNNDHNNDKMTIADLMEIENKIIGHNSIDKNSTIELMIKMIANKNIEHIRDLLEMDKNNKNIINLTDNDNESLLHFSIFSDSYELSRLFLKYGADPNKRDKEGQTPIFRIAFATNDKIIGLLLEYGAVLDIQDKEGNTPLHIAVLTKNYKIIRALLDYSVDPLIYNNNKLLAMDFAISKINQKITLDNKILEIFSEYIN